MGVLIAFSPLLATIVGIAMLPHLYAQLRLGGRRFGLAWASSPYERRAAYYGLVLSGREYAKEVRLFTLSAYFLHLFQSTPITIHKAQRQQEIYELRWQIGLSILSSMLAAATFVVVVLEAFALQLSLGDVTLYIAAAVAVQATLTDVFMSVAGLYEGVLFHRRYMQLLALPQSLLLSSSPQPVPSLASGIEFRDVAFRYSDGHPWVLRHVNLVSKRQQSELEFIIRLNDYHTDMRPSSAVG